MEATKLMIGDWIKTSNNTNWSEDLRGIVCRITNLGDNYIAATDINNLKSPYGISVNFEPIPLTKEILEKNGFKLREGCTSAWDWHNGETSIHISGNHTCPVGQTLTIYVPGGTVGAAFSSHLAISDLKIRGVHELQHAIKLCGIGKTIEL